MYVIKAKFGNEIRRISFEHQPSFSQLRLNLKQIFSLDDIVIRYEDDEHDLITVSSDVELSEAFSLAVQKSGNKNLRVILEKPDQKSKSEFPSFKPFFPEITQIFSDVSKGKLNEETFRKMNPFSQNSKAETKNEAPKEKLEAQKPVEESEDELIKEETPKEAPLEEREYLHSGFICDHCGKIPVGTRFRCSECYDYDLCENCKALNVHDSSHHFFEIKKPGSFLDELSLRHSSSTYEPKVVFLGNVTVEDGSHFEPGTNFGKIWKLKNVGSFPFEKGCRLEFFGGDKLSETEDIPLPAVQPNEEISILLNMKAPSRPGRYISYWRLIRPSGETFGPRVWADIVVTESPVSPKTPAPKLPSLLRTENDEHNDYVAALRDMGFETETERLIHLLKKHNNDVNAVANELLN